MGSSVQMERWGVHNTKRNGEGMRDDYYKYILVKPQNQII